MIRYILMAAMALLIIIPGTAAAQPGTFEKPDIYAVTFYSEYCPICKVLDPKVAQARTEAELDKNGILFITMDFTDKAAINQSKLRAAALGIDGYVKQQGAGTGYVALIDPGTQNELARIEGQDSVDEIKAKFAQTLGD